MKPFVRTHTMERLPMTPLEKLGEALETCIVACAGRRNSERAQAVLDVIREQGWAVVPRVPTEAMVDAYVDAVVRDGKGPRPMADVAPERWAAMIAAAASPEEEK